MARRPSRAKPRSLSSGAAWTASRSQSATSTATTPARLRSTGVGSRRSGVGSLPLSLHGASGLPEADLERAVSLGVAKFNVNTELRTAYFRRLGEDLGVKAATVNLKALGDGVVEAVQEVVEAKLSAFGWSREEA